MGIGSHTLPNNGATNEWLTPPEILKALGDFDTDPCCAVNMPWPTARIMYTEIDNGLMLPWEGRVWCNPPYGEDTGTWLDLMSAHANGIALVFARTETEMFFRYVWGKADAVFFFRTRLHFYDIEGKRASGNAGGPSCLVIYGDDNVEAVKQSGLHGALVDCRGCIQ